MVSILYECGTAYIEPKYACVIHNIPIEDNVLSLSKIMFHQSMMEMLNAAAGSPRRDGKIYLPY